MSSVRIEIIGDNGVDAASQLRAFLGAVQLVTIPGLTAQHPAAAPAVSAEKDTSEAEKEAPKAEEKTAVKPKPKKETAPKDTSAETAEPAKEPVSSSAAELVDDGEDQPATVDGCRIMIRRVANGLGLDESKKLLAKFGVKGAKQIPEDKMQEFIDACETALM